MRRIHIIDQITPGDGYLHGTVALWLDTPATMVKADTTRASQVPWATAAEVQAIQNGTITEMIDTAKVPLVASNGTTYTLTQLNQMIQGNGQASLPHIQATLNASAPPAQWVGAYYDDATATWTNLPN